MKYQVREGEKEGEWGRERPCVIPLVGRKQSSSFLLWIKSWTVRLDLHKVSSERGRERGRVGEGETLCHTTGRS